MPDRRIRLAVLFGGRGGEHDVSCESAASILAGLDRERYEVLPVRIGRDGVQVAARVGKLEAGSAVADYHR